MLSHLKKSLKSVLDQPSRVQEHGSWQWPAFLAAVGAWMAGGLLIGHFVDAATELSPTEMVVVGIVPVEVLGILAVLGVLGWYSKPCYWLHMLKLSRPSPPVWSVARTTLKELTYIVPLVITTTGLVSYLFKLSGYGTRSSPLMEMLSSSEDIMFWMTASIVAVVLAPIAEEIQFRTVLYEALCNHIKPVGAMTLTAVVFAVFHQIPEHIPGLIILGIFLQRARSREDSLWASIFLHAGFNFTSLCLLALWCLSKST